MAHRFFVYILANVRGLRPVLYTGVTSELRRRIAEHRRSPEGFVARYHVTTLVYFESTDDPISAIAREKQIKGWRRAKKVALVEDGNARWRDLMPEVGLEAEEEEEEEESR